MSQSVARDPTAAFFDELGQRGHEPLLANLSGTIRCDVRRPGSTDSWYLEIARGDLAVSRRDGPADAVLGADGDLFDEIVQGRENAMAAALRGALTIDGDARLMLGLDRIFPGPDDAKDVP